MNDKYNVVDEFLSQEEHDIITSITLKNRYLPLFYKDTVSKTTSKMYMPSQDCIMYKLTHCFSQIAFYCTKFNMPKFTYQLIHFYLTYKKNYISSSIAINNFVPSKSSILKL